MRVYLSGPMSGMPEHNFPLFNETAAKWRAVLGKGSVVLNPAENFGGRKSLPYSVYLREDINMLLSATAIAMLPGWRNSHGARFELMVAQILHLEVFNAETMQPFDPPEMVVVAEYPDAVVPSS